MKCSSTNFMQKIIKEEVMSPCTLSKVGLNLALGLVTSCWRPACCRLRLGSMSTGDTNKSHWVGECGLKK